MKVERRQITLDEVRRDPQVQAYIHQANENLKALGYTEHGTRHASLVAHIAGNILEHLGYPRRTVELAEIAAYLHDIGNVVHREHHAMSGALIAQDMLARLGMPWDEIALIINAIGNHEEERGFTSTPISAALVIADKADVHRSRVQQPDPAKHDIHDRVNFAVNHSFVRVDAEKRTIALELTIDTTIASVMEYFEIFLSRMLMCRQAAETLDCRFELIVNDVRLY
ncbi:MAG: HD domain-containing protein [Ardenticatenia bacterium]|uniref:Phosphohydrolase n=1 Tax=Ardenticatena maritima TaxID=872965 RepID=A0A0M9UBU9_9CHLR|nr:HD domain-containing protein [Ardenticatena maritima]KPL86464.1 phosphohydrolase [Ardenticatena maritima]RME09984.1 MAG: HD domain-containing protein [Ardenticatenia bacterium]GAP62244.1 hypothetical protein ARMA_0667 [Ardenticatena maritima]